MTDKEKFVGFKQKKIDDNEKAYGKEIREKYGDGMINKSNKNMINMTQAQHDEVTRLSEEVTKTLAEAFKKGDPSSELAQQAQNCIKNGFFSTGLNTVRKLMLV
jgi:hypothetical protein